VRAMTVTRDVRSKGAAPPDRRAGQDRLRTSPKTPALLILRQRISQWDSLTREQRRSRGPLTQREGASADAASPRHNDGCLCAPPYYASERDRMPRSGLGKTPLTGRAVR